MLSIMSDRLAAVGQLLEKHGQSHLLRFVKDLGPGQLAHLLNQIQAINFDALDHLIEHYVRQRPHVELPSDLRPAPYYPYRGGSGKNAFDAAHYSARGQDLIRKGKIAAFTVAGGQGTRLGWNGPKGTFPATVITGKPLFRVFAEQILATGRKYGITIPWYIMTSPINDGPTRAFFADNNHFNLPDPQQNIFFFPQGVLPSIDAKTGQLLLASKDELALNPDGHGGSIKALRDSGALEHMLSRGIEHLSYYQVDNPIVHAIDPLFIGLHAFAPDSSAEMSSKMVPKAYPEEKVGVFCRSGPGQGKTMVLEYSDLPAELANQKNPDGSLRFVAGSIAIHIISVAFVQRLTADRHRFALPYHRADKKVPFVDLETGRIVEPSKPNAVKLEAFVFDAIPLAESSIVYETNRTEEFAPIKNSEGLDSPATSHQIQSDRAGTWLEANGVKVPRTPDGHIDAKIEISPLTALDMNDLKRSELPARVDAGAELLL
jgi:UDP-N-acetylglucosamine/UDP-N-acetylgalactosamine diphosphorylase